MDWPAAAHKIRAIVLDVDGVMTDGMVGRGLSANVKFFNMSDGHAIKMALREGLLVGILSGSDDPVNQQTADVLNMSFSYIGQKRKTEAFQCLLVEHDLNADECLYMGDDVVDIPLIRQAGIGVAVADAVDEVKNFADVVCTAPGGRGAVREIIVRLMKEKGLWDKAMTRYLA